MNKQAPDGRDDGRSANITQQPSSGKGINTRKPREQNTGPGHASSMKEGAIETSLELPHERDEDKDMTNGQPSVKIQKAKEDVDNGLKDTSKAAELDKTYEKFRD